MASPVLCSVCPVEIFISVSTLNTLLKLLIHLRVQDVFPVLDLWAIFRFLSSDPLRSSLVDKMVSPAEGFQVVIR